MRYELLENDFRHVSMSRRRPGLCAPGFSNGRSTGRRVIPSDRTVRAPCAPEGKHEAIKRVQDLRGVVARQHDARAHTHVRVSASLVSSSG